MNAGAKEKAVPANCLHRWEKQESVYLIAEVCVFCKILRYKVSATADWEYRVPIRVAPLASNN